MKQTSTASTFMCQASELTLGQPPVVDESGVAIPNSSLVYVLDDETETVQSIMVFNADTQKYYTF